MNLSRVSVKLKFFWNVVFFVGIVHIVSAWKEEYSVENGRSFSGFQANIVRFDHKRVRRAATQEPPALAPSTTAATNLTDTSKPNHASESTSPMPTVAVTQIPLLGVNGSGILKVNLTGMPKVSDPIVPDDNFTDMFETPEKIKAQHNLTNLTIDNHNFYNSTFIGNVSYFNEHWANISAKDATVHAVLSNSHRRATTLQLSFEFPFYGNYIHNITVATGGFIYTGDHVHNWLAATQYIAPLMANFDTSLTNESLVKLYDDGEKFTAFWENVTLQEDVNKTFTFAVTLYKNGDIVFAYKDIPISVQAINDAMHPVKVGISDAYLNDNIMFYMRRKTIYEYHRVDFRDHVITNNTILKLIALPTCLQYDTCEACLNHNTGFNCTWCPGVQKCSSGTDRNKQDWKLRKCEQTAISEVGACAAPAKETPATEPNHKIAYSVDSKDVPDHDTAIDTIPDGTRAPSTERGRVATPLAAAAPRRGATGGVVAACLLLSLASVAVWVLYAFKNPHTRSGQLLIKYRPSQWSWKRGEARYTAATIHM